MTRKEYNALPTITLDEVISSMGDRHFGPPAKAGWLVALNKDGQVVMSAGRPAWPIFFVNVYGNNYTVKRIVA